ncbi:ATP-binding cassette sub-family A member 3-like isoform X1 [Trichogramma pretiosum]|uniref:ATP-binding cassette sub-family A member 3-like isoform X1 n=1 Tax=Trichogramma pretiosum TaxID=7493 RepID=UPI0006C94A70|nr:ATP-binding cassette sub-family A member 3-like isoform X1 [Trichogramma pretiosum]
MKEKFRMFRLLLYKNYLVRKRHWKMGLFVEILIPVLLFMLIQACRDFSAQQPQEFVNNTYYETESKEELIQSANYQTMIYFVPENRFTRTLIEKTRKCLKFTAGKITGFNSEEEMLQKYALYQTQSPSNDVVAIVFNKDHVNVTTKRLDYAIRTFYSIPNILYKIEDENFSNSVKQIFNDIIPFTQIQLCLDEAFIKMKAPNPPFKTQISLEQMPYPPYIKIDEADLITRIMFCGFAVIAFLIPLCIESTFAAEEKFIGINVLMAMNGVPTYLNLLSWLISGLIFSVSYVTALILLFNIAFTENVHPYLYYGNSFIFWLTLILHVGHLLTFGMHISAYFSKSLFMVSGILALYGGSSMLQKYSIKGDYFAAVPYLGIFFPNILLFRAFQEVNNYENMLTGIQWKNLFTVGDPVYKTAGSVGMIMIFSIIGTVFHFLMTVYIYGVHPGKYGVKKHPLFFLKFGKTKNKVIADEEMQDYEFNDADKPFESVPRNAYTPGIQIRNLKKEYRTHLMSKMKVQALRGVSVDFYKGQITALLGHNGAGKTTLMSILTGMISPTHGTVLINGKNVREESNVIMNDLGLCPQEDMLFPNLSVYEQIEFFAMLKGKNKSKAAIKNDIQVLLDKLKLFDKRNAMPKELSGGQKRRVCLGMAVIGDSSTLILDEPTSGMDPESRRDTWDIILKMRGQKTILISTHDMEEADILGDRIAIVHQGRLRSYGTSMFLKKLLGHGNIEVTLSTEPWCDAQKCLDQLDARGQILNLDGGKLVLSIPYTPELPDSLDKMEKKKKELGVTGMSVSLITLEQVFLKVTKDNEDVTDSCQPFLDKTTKLKGQSLFIQSILALLRKKITYTRKNIITVALIILLPILCVIFMAMDYNMSNDAPTPMPLHLDMYPQPLTYVRSENPLIAEKFKYTTEMFGAESHDASDFSSLTTAMLDLGSRDMATYRNHLISAAEFNVTENVTQANIFFSDYAMFSIPLSVNLVSNVLLKALTDDEHSISLSVHRLPHSLQATLPSEDNVDVYGTALLFVFFLFPAIALFVIHPLRETLSNVKQLQRMTGVSCFSYWGTMFAFDMAVFLVTIACIVIGFICMDSAIDLRLYEATEIGITILILVLFAINVLPLIYICSFFKKSTSTVITLLSLLPFGLVSLELIMHVIALTLSRVKTVKILRAIQKGVFLLVPYLSFFHGQVSFFTTATKNARCRRLPNMLHAVACLTKDVCCGLDCYDGKCKHRLDYFKNYKDDMSLEESITYLCITPILYFGILAALEYKLVPLMLSRMRNGKYEALEDPCDEQVKKEKHAVAFEIAKAKTLYEMHKLVHNGKRKSIGSRNLHTALCPIEVKPKKKSAKAVIKAETNGNAPCEESNVLSNNDTSNNYMFLVYELSKRYGKLLAVEEISFGVKQHECFGLLGVNGAGKSTTFRMMTGESVPNSGLMYLGNKDYTNNRKHCLSQMGYCPQNDAIVKCLNAYDHLRLFARLRGIPESQVENEVKKWIDRLNLNICASQPSGTYSGGNKRRLNIAMALIGHPNLVLLDEPTTGVDPAARRSLWNVIQSCQTAGQAIILTSHSMEECEALCNRLVIMVNGQLVCVGQCQELKQRFGAGFDIQLKLNPEKSISEMENIKKDIEQALNCELVDENSGFLMYHVTSPDIAWRRMYDLMSELRSRYASIDDFSVLSSSLEQLFLLFARTANRSNRKTYK